MNKRFVSQMLLTILCFVLPMVACVEDQSSNTSAAPVATDELTTPVPTVTVSGRTSARAFTATPPLPTSPPPAATEGPTAAAATTLPVATPTDKPAPTPTASPTLNSAISANPGETIIVDHNAVALLERVPDEYITAAANLNMLFIDRSVGENIDDGLNCLSFPSDEEAPLGCKQYTHADPTFSVDPTVVSWSRPGGFNRDNWDFRFWEGDCGGWYGKVNCFVQMVDPVIGQYDVVSFQFSYLAVMERETIANQPGGYFWDNDNPIVGDVYDQEAFEAQHPGKIFIYWTTSLARGIGTTEAEAFNNQMRQYAIAHNKPLFDVADILSHDPDGNPCYDNRDGVPYTNGAKSENYPDDGLDPPAICQHYTTEVEGGHLGYVSAGKIRVAKAFWVLMARIAGWSGS